jgi:hypothetical protein
MAIGNTIALAFIFVAVGVYLAPHWHEFVETNELLGSGVVPPNSTDVYLVISGDLRLSANQKCWDARRLPC